MKLLLSLALLLCASLSAQVAGLMPYGKLQYFDQNGNPLNGGKVYSYAAGTSTPLSTYADNVGTPNANPTILDSSGRAVIFLGNAAYKIQLTDALGVVQWTVDNITAPAGGTFLPLTGGTVSGSILFSAGDVGSSIAAPANVYASVAFKMSGVNVIDAALNGTFNSVSGKSFIPGNVGTTDLANFGNPFRNIYNMGSFSNSLSTCGTVGVLTGACFTFLPTIDNVTSRSMLLRDNLGTSLMSWQTLEGGVPVSIARSYLHINPDTTLTRDLGTSALLWRKIYGGQINGNALNVGGLGAGAAVIQVYNSGIPFAIIADNTNGWSNIQVGNAFGSGAIFPINANHDLGLAAAPWRAGYFTSISATNITANGLPGISRTVSVLAGDGSGACDVVYTKGIVSSSNCP